MTRSKKESKGTTENKSLTAAMFKALLTAFVITVVVFVVYAILITYTQISESSLQTVVIITTIVSVVVAGIITSRNVEKSGWLYGMITGILYAMLMILTGFALSPEASFSLKTLSTILLSAAGGGIGGMIGINTAKK